jgi:transcriptional antiterminator
MGGLKYYERMKLLIELIEKERTWSPTELAGRLGVTKRTVYNIMNEIRITSHRDMRYGSEEKNLIFFQKNQTDCKEIPGT